MQITPSALNAVFQSFSLEYQAGYDSAKPWYQDVAMTIPSSTRENVYGWMSKIPRMREWLGARVVNNMRGQTYTITNKDWELTVGVDRNDWEDDQLGIYSPLMKMMGQQAALHPNDIMKTLLQDTTSLCFDNKTFFADDHPEAPGEVGSATFDNKLALALSQVNFNTAYAAMATFNGDDHKPLGLMPTLLVVPPQLRSTALTLLRADNVVLTAGDGATTNINKNVVDLLIVPELANEATTWYLLDTSKPVKPFVYQNRKSPQLVSRDNPTDPNVFNNKEFLYGVDSRDNVGYSLPFLAIKSIG